MSPKSWWTVAVFLAMTIASFAQSFGKTTTLQMPSGVQTTGAISVDVDRDGLTDLVLPTYEKGKKFARSIRVWKRRQDALVFRAEPDFVVDVPSDVTAFSVGDVHPDAGWEIVLITAQSVYAWRPGASDKERLVKIAAISFLWQSPGPETTLPWMSATDDLDGDGLEDLFIPEPAGYRLAFQRKSESGTNFDTVQFVRFPLDATPVPGSKEGSNSNRRLSVNLSDDDDSESSGPLAAIEERVPALLRADVDGDGDIDLLGQSDEHVYVWSQTKGQGFAEAPDKKWTLPVLADQRRRLDVSYVSMIEDLDGDKKIDNVIVAGDRRSSDVRTQILTFVQGKPGPGASFDSERPLYGKDGVPTQLLVIAGFAGNPALNDVDGDKLPDLVVGSLRVDTLDALKAAGSDSVDADIYVYKNTGGVFSSRPDLSWRIALKVDGLRTAGRDLAARFVGDVTGDGMGDLMVRDAPTHVALYMVRRQKDKWTVVDRPLWEMKILSGARILRETSGKNGATEFVVIEGAEVFHVRF